MQIAHHSATSPFHHQPLASSTANASTAPTGSSASSSASGTSTATITANDFLQLLVTELQNQDPTANTDPNQYVDQLVQVNSLQQQIQMNQTLDGGPTITGAGNGVLQELMQMNQTLNGDVAAQSSSADEASVPPHAKAHAGNLSSALNPTQYNSAEAVATALTSGPNNTAATAANPGSQNGAFEQFAAQLKAEAQRN